MRACIVSDHEATTTQVREVLLREGLDCPVADLFSLDLAPDRLAQGHPELIIVILAPDPERALGVVSQLHLLTPAPMLAVGPTHDSRLVLRTLRAGAADYADDSDLEDELRTVLGRLRTELPAQAEPARTIAVLAPSGGSGSSTLSVNVATVLAKDHKSVLLLDLKLQSGDLAALLDLKPTHTLAELCQNAARMDRIMLERSLVRHGSGVHLLAPPRSLADVGLVTADGVRQALNLARGLFPYVVIDLDHSFGPEQLQALRLADVVLVVLRLDFTCLRNTQRTLDYLEQLGIGRDRIRVVVNRYGQAKEVPAAKAEEALGTKIFHYVPEDAKTVNRANNNGVPIVLESPWAKVSRSLSKLAQSVNGRHG
ncbi:MAG: AAA family ATPase [Planctomycetes bacterium]|nr:AAA family ATPase [Planctomycetota bacterium]